MASDGALSASDTVQVTVNPAGGGGGLPPDPETVAPPIDPTVATTTYAATEFLYTGSNPIQTGVAPARSSRSASRCCGKFSTRTTPRCPV